MGTYFGLENENKFTERSPDYLISAAKEGDQAEKRSIGIIYRTKSRNGVEYLKVIMDGDNGDPEAKKTFFGFRNRNKKSVNAPDWSLFPPKSNENKKQEAVGAIFESTEEGKKMYFKITFFDGGEGKKGIGIDPNKDNL
jgi:hypothetical protein